MAHHGPNALLQMPEADIKTEILDDVGWEQSIFLSSPDFNVTDETINKVNIDAIIETILKRAIMSTQ